MTTAATRLRGFLSSARLDTARAAKLLGCTRAYVSLLQTGRRVPSLEIAVAIERLSAAADGGPILAAEWVPTSRRARRAA